MAKPPSPKIVSKKHLARLEREQIQRRYLLIGSIIVLVLVVGVIIYGVLDQTVFAANRAAAEGRKAVAKVDTQEITLDQFQTRVRFQRMQMINQYQSYYQMAQMFGQDPTTGYFAQTLQQIEAQLDPNNTSAMGTSVLDQMVDEALIAHEAEKMGITVSDAEVETRMQEAFGYFANGTPTPEPTATEPVEPTLNPTTLALVTITPTPTQEPTATQEPSATPGGPTVTATAGEPTPDLSATPRPTATPYTEAGFKDQVKKYTDEMAIYKITDATLRDVFRAELLSKKVTEKVSADVKPEEEQIWARHILVADEAAAKAALERLNKGEDFCTVAKEVSTDTSNKDTCGDLGWFGKAKQVVEFEQAAFALPVGKISDPVKTSFGYHIIQVLDHQVRLLNSSDFEQAKQKVFTDWLAKLREDKARIEKFDTVWNGKVPTEPAFNKPGA